MDLGSTNAYGAHMRHAPSEDQPDTPTIAVHRMRQRWRVLNALWGGTPVMREATEFLPQEDGESDAAYEVRRKRSTLFGGWKETLMRISSAPFRRPVSIQGEDVPEWVEDLSANVNRAGRDLTQFCHEVFFSGWFYGFGVIMGEAPLRESAEGAGASRTRGDAYLVDIPPNRILGSTIEYTEEGSEVVTSLRIFEEGVEPDGEFREKIVERVRDYSRPLGASMGSVRMWVRDAGTEAWQDDGEYPYSLQGPLGGLPVFPAYVNYTGPLCADPPLEDLAWHNIQHWQSSSDQSNILRFARCATLAITGLQLDDNGEPIGSPNIVMGANRVIYLPEGATAEYIEHSGEGAAAGFQHLDRIEQAMERQGLAPMMRDSARVTATAQHIQNEGANSLLEQSARALENAINDAYEWIAAQRGEVLPDDFRIHLTQSFDVPTSGGESKQDVLLRAATNGLLPVRILLEEFKRDGFISSHHDVAAIVEEIEANRESAMQGFEPFEPEEDDEDDGNPEPNPSEVIRDGEPQ